MKTLDSSRYAWKILLFVMLLLASYLRFETAVTRPLWHDEEITLSMTKLPNLAELYNNSITSYRGCMPFLYPALCWIVAGISTPEWTVRFFSVVAGILSTLLLAQLGSISVSRKTGVIAGFLLAFSVYHIEYSQEGRSYSFFTLTLIASFYFLISFLENQNKKYLIGFIIAALSSLYSHNCALIYLISGLLLASVYLCKLCFLDHNKIDSAVYKTIVVPVILSILIVLILYLPGFVTYLSFIKEFRTGQNNVLNLSGKFIIELFGRWGNGAKFSWIYLILFVLGSVNLLKEKFGTFILSWFITPFLVFVLISSNKSFFDIRYLIGSLPAFFLIVASGLLSFANLSAKSIKLVSSSNLPEHNFKSGASIIEIFVFAGLIYLSLSTYLIYRVTEQKCSLFPYNPEVMFANDEFCKKHIILNSLYSEQNYILKWF